MKALTILFKMRVIISWLTYLSVTIFSLQVHSCIRSAQLTEQKCDT